MEKDLSQYHYPITDLFSDRENLSLTPEQYSFFHENGFLSAVDFLSRAEVEILRSEMVELMDGRYAGDSLFYEYNRNESNDPALILFHALGAWRLSPAFHDLVFHPTLATMAAQLLGGPVRFWHDQVFVKPPKEGGVVAWHQDYSYWVRTKPMAHLTCWIGLDDAGVENGCVHYVPGSHRWDLLPRKSLASGMNSVFEVLTEEQKAAFHPIASVTKAGQVSFHHPLTLHGSYENKSGRPRRAAVINFMRDGVCSDSNEPLLEGVPAIPKGQKIDGQFFPLLTGQLS